MDIPPLPDREFAFNQLAYMALALNRRDLGSFFAFRHQLNARIHRGTLQELLKDRLRATEALKEACCGDHLMLFNLLLSDGHMPEGDHLHHSRFIVLITCAVRSDALSTLKCALHLWGHHLFHPDKIQLMEAASRRGSMRIVKLLLWFGFPVTQKKCYEAAGEAGSPIYYFLKAHYDHAARRRAAPKERRKKALKHWEQAIAHAKHKVYLLSPEFEAAEAERLANPEEWARHIADDAEAMEDDFGAAMEHHVAKSARVG